MPKAAPPTLRPYAPVTACLRRLSTDRWSFHWVPRGGWRGGVRIAVDLPRKRLSKLILDSCLSKCRGPKVEKFSRNSEKLFRADSLTVGGAAQNHNFRALRKSRLMEKT